MNKTSKSTFQAFSSSLLFLLCVLNGKKLSNSFDCSFFSLSLFLQILNCCPSYLANQPGHEANVVEDGDD